MSVTPLLIAGRQRLRTPISRSARLANLPLVVAIMAFLLAFGPSHIRTERARASDAANPKNRKSGD